MIKEAKQIWIMGENEESTWMCFRRNFEWNKSSNGSADAEIAVDSKYWLYVNGRLAIREGGLKRGPSRNGTYYERINLDKYVEDGTNTLAILVCFFGKSGFSHVSSGYGGLRFAMNGLKSDETWKVKKHPAYVKADPSDPPANFRLAEANIYFDASKDIAGWQTRDYDDSDWRFADVLSDKEALAWGRLEKRITPQLKDFGLKTFKTTCPQLRLPYNAQFTPYLKVTAPAGRKIIITTDNYNVGMYGEKSTMSVYYTKDGMQEYEALGWMNGEWIYYQIPEDVIIHELGYRESGYNTEVTKTFHCKDEFLNKLWDKCVRTLYVTMRDTFMDCPDRERVQWWGDVTIEMQEALCCLDERALLLYKKGVQSLAGWAEDGAHMMTVVPSGTEQFELPMQNLAGIWGFGYYYDHTGDIEVPQMAYKMSMEYLRLFNIGDNGLVEHRTGSWDWPDWGEHADIAVMENAWYYMALQACRKMADIIPNDDYNEDMEFISSRMSQIEQGFNKCYLKTDYYYNQTDNNIPDDRANALAVLSGLANKETYPGIRKILITIENSSPYMEKYVLDALCEMGYIDDAVARIKRRYKEMVDEDYSTLWEYWSKDGTKNHAWSGGPLIIMDKYLREKELTT